MAVPNSNPTGTAHPDDIYLYEFIQTTRCKRKVPDDNFWNKEDPGSGSVEIIVRA